MPAAASTGPKLCIMAMLHMHGCLSPSRLHVMLGLNWTPRTSIYLIPQNVKPLATGSATVAYVLAEVHVTPHLIERRNWIDIEVLS